MLPEVFISSLDSSFTPYSSHLAHLSRWGRALRWKGEGLSLSSLFLELALDKGFPNLLCDVF
jgi:hypothetical protein